MTRATGALGLSRPRILDARAVPPVDVPLAAAGGVVLIVAALVGLTVIGSGDYGQWLMVSRGIAGLSTPGYRDLSDVPPLVPATIAALHAVLVDPVLTLHAVAFLIAAGIGGALFLAGKSLRGSSLTGLAAVALGLLVTDQFLQLLAFGGLLQGGAMVFLVLAFAAFSLAVRSSQRERRWWLLGCFATFLVCLTHVPTATIALPFCAAAAAIAALPRGGETVSRRLRDVLPLVLGFGLVVIYWAVAVAPQSSPYVANPASLAYRGPGRLLEQLAGFPPTLAVMAIGAVTIAVWGVRLARHHSLAQARSPETIALAWGATAWGAFAASALGGASTDYPRFAPLLVVPLAVTAAGGLAEAARWLSQRARRPWSTDHGLIAVALGVVAIAPFSIANYQTAAAGYRLPDEPALSAAATWADSRVVPGQTILAPVREAKWVEGLTGRSTLFASQVRYAFRPDEWARSLAANALLRGDMTLVNEDFVATFNDAVRAGGVATPRGLTISANHGGESLDLLRLVPAGSLVYASDGTRLASLPALDPEGMDHSQDAAAAAVTTRWSGTRAGEALTYATTVSLGSGSNVLRFEVHATGSGGIGGLRAELRPLPGMPLVSTEEVGSGLVLTFARTGTSEPRLRIDVPGGSVSETADGGLVIASSTGDLAATITDLTAGGASATLAVLVPAGVVQTYGVGAVILSRDPAYEDRRDRLEFLGFRVAHAEGPYVVMVRAGSGRPAP